VHTTFSPDSLLDPQSLIRLAGIRGLGCVAITDHNTMDGVSQVIALKPLLRIIPGEEITTQQGEVIGLFLQEAIPAGLSVWETIQRIHCQGGIVTVPHPCDRLRRHVLQKSYWTEVLPLVDMIEGFNGRTVFKADDRFAQKIAAYYQKPVIAGSDSHTPWELGHCGMEIENYDTCQDLIEVISGGRYFGTYTLPWSHLITKAVKYRNRWHLRKY
jgi:predicted metal-dependent phosphoesterase TrpH